MRASILSLGACAVLVSGSAFAATSSTSWGKVDVSFTQYRADSQSCAEQGLDTALQQHAGNWESQGIQNSPEDYLRTFQSRALDKRRAQITEGQSALDGCLIRLGYRKPDGDAARAAEHPGARLRRAAEISLQLGQRPGGAGGARVLATQLPAWRFQRYLRSL